MRECERERERERERGARQTDRLTDRERERDRDRKIEIFLLKNRRLGAGERITVDDGSVDLVTISQALHWLKVVDTIIHGGFI